MIPRQFLDNDSHWNQFAATTMQTEYPKFSDSSNIYKNVGRSSKLLAQPISSRPLILF